MLHNYQDKIHHIIESRIEILFSIQCKSCKDVSTYARRKFLYFLFLHLVIVGLLTLLTTFHWRSKTHFLMVETNVFYKIPLSQIVFSKKEYTPLVKLYMNTIPFSCRPCQDYPSLHTRSHLFILHFYIWLKPSFQIHHLPALSHLPCLSRPSFN